MSESIDRRVVEMRFNNKDFENNVQSTLTVLDKLKQKLNLKDAEKAMGASGLGSAIDGVKERFSALEVVGMTALINLTNSAINLGKNLAKSLTVDQVSAGFSEYELKMGSIQTIMASTGADIQTVNKYLNDLNTYSDKTIYSFSDMTSSIGKFTNAGVDLDVAVKAIQGISNEAAVSGANAQEASRAMYNFAQALSAGYVKLIDWKSIENANMATKEFKQQLIDTAVEMGNLEKNADGTYKVLTQGANGAFKENITATQNFNDSLSAAWMTTDVLTTTLGRYADETTEIGKKAFAAAQDVKTFSQLIDTVKEAIGSGWAQTFELIFGNLEEAKKIWTAVNNVLSDFISKSSDARNGVLQIWKATSGRAALLDGFKQLYLAVSAFVAPIKEAFADVFDPIRGEQLTSLSFRFRDFAKSLMISGETAEKVKRVFTVIFTVLKTGLSIIKGIVSIFGSLIKVITPLGGTTLNVLDKISSVFLSLTSSVSALSDKLKSLTSGLFSKAITGLGKAFAFLGEGLSKLNLAKVGGLLAGGLVGGGAFLAFKKLGQVFDTLRNTIDILFGKGGGEKKDGLLAGVKETLGSLSDTLNQFQASLKIGQLVTVAIAIGILAASCSTLAEIPAKKLAVAVGALGGLFTELGIASHLMTGANTKGIISMAAAVIILAEAVKMLSEVENMGKGLLGVGVLLGELTAFCLVFDKLKIKPKSLQKTATGLILMAVAINLLAKPVKELGALDTGQLVQGLVALGVMLGEFAATSLAFSKINTKGMMKAGAAMVLMAAAMRMLVGPLSELGGMKLSSLAKGLGAMAVALLEIVGFTAIMGKIASTSGNILKASAALLVMSVGIKIMASAIGQMGADANAGQGLSVLFGSLLILSAAMAVMQKCLPGAAAMIIVAGALMIMAPAIALLSSLDIKGVFTGLLALAGTLVVFGAAAVLLGPVVPLMIALSAAMALLGVGVLSLGAGMTMLVAAFSMATGPIIEGAQAIAKAFPIIAKGIGEGLITIIKTIGDTAQEIKNSFVKIMEAAIEGIYEVGPRLIEAGLFLLLKLLEGIDRNIGAITDRAISIIVNFVNAISDNLPMVVDAAFNLVITFLNTMADAISNNSQKLSNAIQNVILAAIAAAVRLIPGFGKPAADAIEKYRKGLSDGEAPVRRTASSISSTADSNLQIPSQYSNGYNAVSGLVSGLNSMKGTLRSTASTIASIVDDVIRKKNQIQSPSKRLFKTGSYLMQGLIGGIDSLTGEYQKKADNIATVMIASATDSVNGITSAMNRSLASGFNLTDSLDRAANVDFSLRGIVDRNKELNDILDRLSGSLDNVTDTMNSRQLINNIQIEGSEDPNVFADALTRRFKLNARTM